MPLHLNRRAALGWLSAAATVGTLLPAHLSLAAPDTGLNPNAHRLVVVMLRGALDGLAAVPALHDPAWDSLRRESTLVQGPYLPLDGLFALHPSLPQLHRWYQQKELLLVHATASPYRERSHFDAQQLLESGGQRPFELSTGWLGRALQALGQPALALTASMPLALRGAKTASTWTPERQHSADADLLERVRQLYAGDPALHAALDQAIGQQAMAMDGPAAGGASAASLARQAGRFLAEPKGPRVAWLELAGWDTHTNQSARLARQLKVLDDSLTALREGLGAHWQQTTVLVMTEFGRSAAMNGSGGTDHGTGGVALVAGGAVAGGRVLADWPGLRSSDLLDGRDLRPTQDVRALLAALVQHQFGLGSSQLQTHILPGFVGKPLPVWQGSA
ncbi:MAG: DUF1501 domain-containing protein [Rhodoferax sp.]|uniref:DUF1501 domain-containing protein n=1 Tax=Rhodoferax sp. TaxID=50421 RepID=UPI001B452F38|nr:DUF1501 domain-containing protein [Rhodoferax sp.]MBP9903929.1 DUF1501 domain-containing protein [Rhodoferax sp.]